MNSDKILIVDDDEGIRTQLKWALSVEYEVLLASNAKEALELLEAENPQLIALDITLSPYEGEKDGMYVLEKVLEKDPLAKVIMITGNEDRNNALKTVKLGAYDYYVKPIVVEELKVTIKRALYIQKLEKENRELSLRLEEGKSFENMITSSFKMKRVFEIIEAVAATNETVLISGESGTGKEMVAKAIHQRSLRKEKPFIPINCGAIPETLLESELFGHEKGAYTDAHIQRKGMFEHAEGGTIFLDEIGELSLPLQVKILRFLEDHEIKRIGGKESIHLDVRVLAATNKTLEQEVLAKNFREDLFYRLSVISINLPPLRDRGEDIEILANYFLNKYVREYNKTNLNFTPETFSHIKEYHWPGNIRELENKVKRGVILSTGKRIFPQDMGFEIKKKRKEMSLQNARETAEIQCLKQALEDNAWNISQAAKQLEVSRTNLYNLMQKYGLAKGPEV
jgi:two-component system NtrC family response regulator